MLKNKQDHKGFSLVELVIVLVILIVLGFSGYFVYKQHNKASSQSNQQTTLSSGSMNMPKIPTNSAYLGAWVNPGKGTGIGTGKSDELAQLAAFNSAIGKSVAILHTWVGFKTALPTATLNAISQNGSIPLIDWGCADVASISSGAQDTTINNFANGLKSYGKPVFLRWYWEFNQGANGKTPAGSGCNGYNNGPGFIAAWQHIYTQFQKDGVKNVAFVWCPGYSGGNFASYYPGDKYVDWVGIDRYVRTKNNSPVLSFSDMFSSYYNEYSSHNKPIMIAETAAMGSTDQSQYLTSVLSESSKFPDIKAFVYFDSIGPAGDWSLTGDGITAYKAMADSNYFSAPVN